MIVIPCVQGSPEWIAARCGIPTSSNFSKILTPGGKLSASAEPYICQLIAERILGASLDPYVSDWMERGKMLEPEAVAYYEMQRDQDTEAVGFAMHDTVMAGCSPDRLVGSDGGLEIKCPSPAVHVGNLLGMAEKHRCQVQGSLWITGRAWWDLLSFHPEMPPALIRIERDEEYIAALDKAIREFCERLEESRLKIMVTKDGEVTE